MAEVRTYKNADIPEIVRVWNSHHELSGLAYPVATTTFYEAVIDRQNFNSNNMIVISEADHIAGFSHAVRLPNGELRLVGAWCEPGDDALANSSAMIAHWVDRGLQVAGLTIAEHEGYVGLTQYSGLVGIADADSRQTSWLRNHGFQPKERHASIQVSIPTFRPPVDRRIMQLRRTCGIQEVDFTPGTDSSWESGWGYLDPLVLQLRERAGKALAQIVAWNTGFGEVFPYSDVLLTDLLLYPGAADGSDLLLVAEALRELGSRRFLTARTVVDDAHPAHTTFWQSLGFRIIASGAVYSR